MHTRTKQETKKLFRTFDNKSTSLCHVTSIVIKGDFNLFKFVLGENYLKYKHRERCYEVPDNRKKLMRLVCTGEPEHLINYVSQSYPEVP